MVDERSNRRRDKLRRARQRRLTQFAAIAAAAAVVVGVMVAIGSAGSAPPPVADAQAVSAQLAGMPQADMTLGDPNAAVTINEYGDLQCTACAVFATGILPDVIDRLVKSGSAKLVFHNWTIIDQIDSVAAAEAAYAAGLQGRAWQFIELFYRSQGEERSGYVTEGFLDRLAKASGLNVARFDSDRRAPVMAARVRADGQQALSYGFQGTPSFTVSGPRGTRVLGIGVPGSVRPFADAIRAVS